MTIMMINKNNMITPTNFPQILTSTEVAKILKVTSATVRNMIKRGDLDAVQIKSGRGIYRITTTALRNLIGEDRTLYNNDHTNTYMQ